VRHFSLLADRATVLRQLRGRGFGLSLRPEQWAVSRLDECLAQLQDPLFATHVHTDDRSVPEVAEVIARSAGLAIRPDTDGVVRARLRRYRTSLAHIHLG
jgi:hypothetical protein